MLNAIRLPSGEIAGSWIQDVPVVNCFVSKPLVSASSLSVTNHKFLELISREYSNRLLSLESVNLSPNGRPASMVDGVPRDFPVFATILIFIKLLV